MQSKYKILIIGSPGSGKTTLANELKKILNIECFHLDDLYWLKDWERPKESDWIEKINTIVLDKEEWIIDGNYYPTLPQRMAKSNFVIYLDCSTILCVYRILRRALIRRFISQETLPKAVKENKKHKAKLKINFKFIKLVVLFKLIYKPKILKLLAQYNVKFIKLHHPIENSVLCAHFQFHYLNKNEGCILCN